jgi:sigma-E factor negative regulatory protein RseA
MLSALADGEAVESECVAAFLAWREDADVRATWHAYHLIGDILRSDDLASPADRGCRLLQGVRARLAEEPVVLAPVQAARSAPARRRWQSGAAMAAGFLVVVVGVQMARAPRSDEATLAVAKAASGPATGPTTVADRTAPPPTSQVMPYVTAHRLSTMDAVLTMPGQMPAAELRNASIVQASPR